MGVVLTKQRRSEKGSALLIVFVLAAAVAITLYAELPVATFEARRAKEQQLVERGNEYAHAVKLYVHKFGHYPASIEALEDTNRMRFLRHRYKDPFTGQDDWRLLHAGPGGTLADSKVNPVKPNDNGNNTPENNPWFGDTASAARAQSSSTTGEEAMPPVARRPPAIVATAGDAPAVDASLSEASPDPSQPLLPRASDSTADTGATSSGAAAANPTSSSSSQPAPIGQIMGGGIAGVASSAPGRSIKAINEQTDYSLWEFYYDPLKDPMRLGLAMQQQNSSVLPVGDAATKGAPGFGAGAAPGNPASQPSSPGDPIFKP